MKKIEQIIGPDYIYHYTNDKKISDIHLMRKDGLTFCHIYWYNDDNTTIYLESLSVDESIREQGIGTELINMCEEIGITLKAKFNILAVEICSWMYDWYVKLGYIFYSTHTEDGLIWMRKVL